MTSATAESFVETKEHRRFHEFCTACEKSRYIGLCYGPPGVGKTLSARHYANWKRVEAFLPIRQKMSVTFDEVLGSRVVFYTPPVVNSPGKIEREISQLRAKLRELAAIEMTREEQPKLDAALKRLNRRLRPNKAGLIRCGPPYEKAEAEFLQLHSQVSYLRSSASDPTALIIIDEADRLRESSLEQVRDIFDRGGVGVVLIGMPGLEKRLARYPQLYSRVGFVHEFRALAATEVRRLLTERWRPRGVVLPNDPVTDEETVATILRVTGGNFRLLQRLLTQIARVLEINELPSVTAQVVEAARENLVIGAN